MPAASEIGLPDSSRMNPKMPPEHNAQSVVQGNASGLPESTLRPEPSSSRGLVSDPRDASKENEMLPRKRENELSKMGTGTNVGSEERINCKSAFKLVPVTFVLRCSMGSANCRGARQPTQILTTAYGSSGSELKTGNRFRSTTNRKYSQGGESDVLY
jgi:hypothetical protein